MFDYYNLNTGTWNSNPRYKEILKLDKMLSEANISHTLTPNMDGWQVWYPNANPSENVMDAIEHSGSYGRECDLIEIMGLLTPEEAQYDSVKGNLTAEDVFERIRKHYNGEWDDYIKNLDFTPLEDSSDEDTSDIPANKPLTPEDFKQQMQDAYDVYYLQQHDNECVHSVMDDIMCSLLRQLGYGEGIDIFEHTPKWYA